MKNKGISSEEEKWRAVINCDKQYDGLFYYGVKTTGIFCRPSCRAKTPLRENTLFFNDAKAAENEGFRPCKLCRPDIIRQEYEPNKELIQKIQEKLKESCEESVDLRALSQEFGISISHLTRLFKAYCGIPPIQYVIKLRVDRAKKLLKQSDISILEIAYMTGFKSESNFYKSFKEQTGYTPKEYRKNNGDL